jgi:hypothetical protein
MFLLKDCLYTAGCADFLGGLRIDTIGYDGFYAGCRVCGDLWRGKLVFFFVCPVRPGPEMSVGSWRGRYAVCVCVMVRRCKNCLMGE